ncbi:hypothetical protein E8P82_05035 [Arthrobacter echini]|uniref:Uncharacterized protein n=1 Tax=Arthrobacter echini TaxID=1529066 RepID=A0A4S5E7I0_9MICC|nr:hypothetical protein [Arthrobacter echini]THJ67462.1 hypothetical protein E8P82_05035 [Arthrobacter echini]
MNATSKGRRGSLRLVPSDSNVEGPDEARLEDASGRAGLRRRSAAVHPAAGRQKLQVLVQIDEECRCIRIVVRGCLTPLNVHGLDLVIARAGTLSRDSTIVVDTSQATRWDGMDAWLQPAAIDHRIHHIHRDPSGNSMVDQLTVLPAS